MTEPSGGALVDDVESIRDEYRRRAVAPQCAGQYTLLNETHAYLVLERERAILAALARGLCVPLPEAEVLDVGSSSGVSLALLAAYGADARRLHGVDIMEERIEQGRRRFPELDLRLSDGVTLPYEDSSMDLVQQITMLSSVHSAELRRKIAAEMLRVLRPGGLVLSYDVAPVPLAPRALNRLLSLPERARARREAPRPIQPDAGADAAPPVALRPVSPLDEEDLRTLFAPAEPVDLVRLTPYRPLVDRFGRNRVALAVLSYPALCTALLYAARLPGP